MVNLIRDSRRIDPVNHPYIPKIYAVGGKIYAVGGKIYAVGGKIYAVEGKSLGG